MHKIYNLFPDVRFMVVIGTILLFSFIVASCGPQPEYVPNLPVVQEVIHSLQGKRHE